MSFANAPRSRHDGGAASKTWISLITSFKLTASRKRMKTSVIPPRSLRTALNSFISLNASELRYRNSICPSCLKALRRNPYLARATLRRGNARWIHSGKNEIRSRGAIAGVWSRGPKQQQVRSYSEKGTRGLATVQNGMEPPDHLTWAS